MAVTDDEPDDDGLFDDEDDGLGWSGVLQLVAVAIAVFVAGVAIGWRLAGR